jgi:DNA modification methylase
VKIEKVKITEVKRNTTNPRIIKDDKFLKLVESIKTFPQMLEIRPIVVNDDMVVLGGNMRLKACQEAGLKEVFIIKANQLTELQQKEFVIKDNVGFGEWDWVSINNEWGDLPLDDSGLDIPDFETSDEINEGLTDEDAVPDVQAVSVSREGDVWLLGNHRLMCGDSTSIDAVEKLMNGKKADMVFTDPPYGVSYTGGHNAKKRTGIIADTLEGENLTGLFYGALSCAILVTDKKAPFYVWYASGKSIETFASLSNLPLELRAVIQWYKVKSGLGAFMSQYIPNCEPCMYLFKTGEAPNWYGPTDEKTVWELKKESRNDFHPTQKPIELPIRAINNSSKKNDTILDLFGGSGSTLIACEKNNRNARLMELDPKYVDVIIKRWQDFTGKQATLEIDGRTFNEVSEDVK